MRKKGGQKLMEMARRGRSKTATKQEAKPAVAGSDRLRLGPVGDKPMFENFNYYSIASDPKEEGGLMQKVLQVFKGDRDYSQPVNPDQEKQEKELGEAVSLLKSIETGLGKITPSTTKLPSEDKEAMLEKGMKRRLIRELIDLDNLPEIKEAAAKIRRDKKRARLSTVTDTVDKEAVMQKLTDLESAIGDPDSDSFEATMQGLADIERETFERFPYPEDKPQMIAVYREIGKMYGEEIGVGSIPPERVHLLIYAEGLDPNFKKFFDGLNSESIKFE
jgi:hypothetical protein